MAKLDLVLINPGSHEQIYQSLADSLTAVEPPVWAGLLASFARVHGLSVRILDANAEGLGPEDAARKVAEMDPLLAAAVVYGHQPSASTQSMPAAGAISAAIKEHAPELKTLLVGGHVAALPERSLREEAADFVCTGEGPHTMVELVQALKTGRSEEYAKVRGLSYWEDGEIRLTPAAPLVRELELEMPGVAWDLLPMDKYRAHNWHCFGDLRRQPYGSLYTTLGCPYHCSFCCIQAPFKGGEKEFGYQENVNSYRFWKPEFVIGQIDILVNQYGVRDIKIADEMFVLHPRHVAGIADLIIERGYDLNIWAYARIDTVRDDMVDKLKRAGFNWLAFGVESGSERVRAEVEKRFEQDEILRTIQKVRAGDISVGANYIFGLPEDDLESMQDTLDLALDLNTEWANFYCAMAYPGSRLYLQAQTQGWPLPEAWSGYSQHAVDSLPLRTKYLTAGEVLRFRDQAFQTYYRSPTYLQMITSRFGATTTQHIQEMASHQLVRQYA